MNVKRIFLLGTIVLLFSQYPVKAYTEKDITQYSNGIVKTVEGCVSEENQILNDFEKEIMVNGELYNVSTIERELAEENTKEETKQKTEILNTNKIENIKKHFGETYSFENEEYKGELLLDNTEVKVIDQGSYEEIDEKRIDFNNYSQNDLNDIAKEKVINKKTYYLINVDWQVEKSETIDNQEVPISYKGVMIYQTVLTKKNPSKYEVTVFYKGNVERKDSIYKYSILYEPVKDENPIVEENKILPIIISGLGIGIFVVILLINSGNIKVYNKTDTGYKCIGKFKITNKNKVIDISKQHFKTNSNMYSLKLSKSLYRKIKNETIFVQISKYKKQIYVNSQFIEFII